MRLANQEFKAILRYIESWGIAWATLRLSLKKEEEAGNIVYLVECLPGMDKVLGLVPSILNWVWWLAHSCLKQTK